MYFALKIGVHDGNKPKVLQYRSYNMQSGAIAYLGDLA